MSKAVPIAVVPTCSPRVAYVKTGLGLPVSSPLIYEKWITSSSSAKRKLISCQVNILHLLCIHSPSALFLHFWIINFRRTISWLARLFVPGLNTFIILEVASITPLLCWLLCSTFDVSLFLILIKRWQFFYMEHISGSLFLYWGSCSFQFR